MSPIIYEPDDYAPPSTQKELSNIYGNDLKTGTIIYHDGNYYKVIRNSSTVYYPAFLKMNSLEIWWARKTGKIT